MTRPSYSGYDPTDRAFFDWGWFSKAKEDYRNILNIDTGNDAVRWKIVHLSWLLSEPEVGLEHIEALYNNYESRDRELRDWRYFYQAQYRKVREGLADKVFSARRDPA